VLAQACDALATDIRVAGALDGVAWIDLA